MPIFLLPDDPPLLSVVVVLLCSVEPPLAVVASCSVAPPPESVSPLPLPPPPEHPARVVRIAAPPAALMKERLSVERM
jgi:hypothetical protein